MANITVEINITPSKLKAFTFNEAEIHLIIDSSDEKIYWLESIIEVPHPLSLAQDKLLERGKIIIGLVGMGHKRKKRIKFFTANTVYPLKYQIKLTLFIYDEDGAIEERKEYAAEVACEENA